MIFFNYITKVTALSLIFTVLFSCSGKSEVSSAKVHQTGINLKERKPGASIKLVSAAIVFINPNEQTPVDLEFEVGDTGAQIEIDFEPTDGLSLVNRDPSQSINMSAFPTVKRSVSLLAPANGRYYLNMHVRMNNGDKQTARILALIVQVGTDADPKMKLKKPSEENVISLPAQEKISTQ